LGWTVSSSSTTTRSIARTCKINCPGVLVLQLPGNTYAFPSFLDHIWAFDRRDSTKEDQIRTRMYQEGTQRQQYREQSFSLKDFVQDCSFASRSAK
jgi:predicted enzyme involved in methoxymalonyl-ACP biosynthesis